jgi:hypothetical protein
MLNWNLSHPGVELGGCLSGDGSEMMRATVYINPVGPPPSQLDGLVTPVRDPAGVIIDWRLAPVRPSLAITHEDIDRYRQWRLHYASEVFLGERALVVTFLDWAGSRHKISELEFLRNQSAYIDNAHAYRLRRRLDVLIAALFRDAETGIGLFMAPGRRAASRALMPTDPPNTVLSSDRATITASAAGLMLNVCGPDGAVQHLTIRGWRLHQCGVFVNTGKAEQNIPDSPAAWLISTLGRDQPDVAVRPTKMSALLAPTLMFLRDAADTAISTHTGLATRTGLS